MLRFQDDVLRKISEDIECELELGLEKGTPDATIAMLPSFVPALPDGSETGKYIAIDLSGKNLRIMLLTLKGVAQEPEQINHNFIVPASVMKGTGDQLFTFIVNCLMKFLKEVDLLEANLPIGFVFSYPCELTSIRSARLLWWTKGFDIQDCLQKDVVRLLEEALDLNMLTNAKVKAIMNDTVGQLAAAAFKYGTTCTMGVVIGYGCNSSYLEDTAKVKKFNAAARNYKHEKMVVVTEWEEFGSHGQEEGLEEWGFEICRQKKRFIIGFGYPSEGTAVRSPIEDGSYLCIAYDIAPCRVRRELPCIGKSDMSSGKLSHILTQFDHEIDDASVHKGKQMIDKLTGALYLGDLVRRILAQLVLDGFLFSGKPCEKLDEVDSFPTKFISEILAEDEDSFKVCRRICDEMDVPSHCTYDYEIMREVCLAVSRRSASIVAAAVSALLRHMGQKEIKIGVGGALIQFHPTYHVLLEEKLKALAPPDVKWQLVPADEGSAKGAAMLAAVVEKMGL
uniref:Phosphotransferase n=1 Tax=Ascaris lumbricoides TaxID=6252 RepID=A0A0M3HYA9_ASCLU